MNWFLTTDYVSSFLSISITFSAYIICLCTSTTALGAATATEEDNDDDGGILLFISFIIKNSISSSESQA